MFLMPASRTRPRLVTALNGQGGALVISSTPQFRLTLTSGVAVTTADVAGATTVYATPAGGNQVMIYRGTLMVPRVSSEIALALDSNAGHTGYQQSGNNFDCFLYWTGTAVGFGTGPSWSAGAVAGSNTARGTGAGSTDLQFITGIATNKNPITLRVGSASGNLVTVATNQATYIGSIRTTADGQVEDSATKRFTWSAFQSAIRAVLRQETAGTTWTYSTAVWRQVNANTANKVETLTGLQGAMVSLKAAATFTNSTATLRSGGVAIGQDSTTISAGVPTYLTAASQGAFGVAFLDISSLLGYHALNWLEMGAGTDTQTWFAQLTPATNSNVGTGIFGTLVG
jgi:hypothetical protein